MRAVYFDDSGAEDMVVWTNSEFRFVFVRQDISPAQAADYLTRNDPSQRKVDHDKVHEIASQIRAGMWEPGCWRDVRDHCIDMRNTAALSGPTEDVTDGQHRLEAIVESGMTTSMWVWVLAEPVGTEP